MAGLAERRVTNRSLLACLRVRASFCRLFRQALHSLRPTQPIQDLIRRLHAAELRFFEDRKTTQVGVRKQ
jgi:hypothetical protein